MRNTFQLIARSWIGLKRLCFDRSGNISVILAFSLVPMTLLISASLDISRALSQKSQLQAAVDSAALAGTQAYATNGDQNDAKKAVDTFMNGVIPTLGGSVTYTMTPAQTGSAGFVSSYAVKIAATETLSNQTLSLTQGLQNTTLGVSATAKINMSYIATFKLNGFYSNACDGNSVYWYVIPSDNSVPAASTLTQVWSNTATNNPASATMQVVFGQKIGFALKNVTGQQCAYGTTQYGSTTGQTNWFYSHLTMPSAIAFPSVAQNCSLTTILDPTQSQLPPNLPGTLGTCSPVLADNAALDCSQLVNHTVLYLWNDMGGSTDDRDYNDADYSVSCAVTSGGVTAGTGAVLTQ